MHDSPARDAMTLRQRNLKRRERFWILALVAFVRVFADGPHTIAGPGVRNEPLHQTNAKDVALRVELLRRAKRDQHLRSKLVDRMRDNGSTIGSKDVETVAGSIIAELKRIDADNGAWLKQVVDRHGWPGKTKVGSDGAQAAFLLVQHADHDLQFQKHCLKLMQQLPAGEVAPDQIALLMDRTRLADGRKQVYGTQVELKNGEWIVSTVENRAALDKRRREIGLPPIEEYLETVRSTYGSPVNWRSPQYRARAGCPGNKTE